MGHSIIIAEIQLTMYLQYSESSVARLESVQYFLIKLDMKPCISVCSVVEFPGAGSSRLRTINSELNGAT